jgi:internalin A
MLHFEGNRALVRADKEERRVGVRVDGPRESRRRLLAIVRAHFEELHAQFTRLQPQALVPVDGFPGEWIPYDELLAYEEAGDEEYKKVIAGKVIHLSVSRLLGMVDLEGQRPGKAGKSEQLKEAAAGSSNVVQAFISYSHKDEHFRAELDTHLKLLHRQGPLNVWHDRRIEPGEQWDRKINDALNDARIIILMVSVDFVSSKYCYEEEMQVAIERSAAGKSTLIWIPVRDCDVTGAPFANLQAATKDALPIELAPNRDTAWKEVSQKIRAICEQLKHP